MPSITSWTRLEPQCVTDDVGAGVAARLFDPMWLLARQRQVREFQGEDGGTPIVARWRAQVAPLTRCHLGAPPPDSKVLAARFDSENIPLEVLVERQPTLPPVSDSPGADGLRLAVENGQHFLRLLGAQPMSIDYGPAFVKAYPVAALTLDQKADLDPAALAYADFVAGRALDGRRLRAALTRGADGPHLDPALGIATGDRAEVRVACDDWLNWSDALFSQPAAGSQAWQTERMEYTFSVAARLGGDAFGERTLTAEQYFDGAIDWFSFDLNGAASIGAVDDEPGTIVTRTVLPAPVTFHGMPAPRFWEFEDAVIDVGALQPGATDLPRLLMIDTMSGYGNDWFVIPIELPVGSLVESRSLVVTDTFGFRTLHRPNGDPALEPQVPWNLFQFATPGEPGDAAGAAVTNLFFLPPTLVQPHEGPAVEEVMLLRDEMANLAWAIERRLESPLEIGLDAGGDAIEVEAETPPSPLQTPVYRVASDVPPHWIPLLPVRLSGTEVRLSRAALLDIDGSRRVVAAQARVLRGTDEPGRLLIHEEEIPRAGAVIRRSVQAARWYDGQLFAWTGYRKSVGRGEGSSGLRFDALAE